MIITVDPADREPPYQQIRIQVLAAVASGALRPTTRLPTIRQLAADLDLAPNTVARAYRELEAEGVIETRGRKGTFVRDVAVVAPDVQRERQLTELTRRCVDEARRLGASPAEMARAFARAIAGPSS